MLKKGLALLLAVTMVFSLSGCSDILGGAFFLFLVATGDDSADKDEVFDFVSENEEELLKAIEAGDYSAFENQGFIKDIEEYILDGAWVDRRKRSNAEDELSSALAEAEAIAKDPKLINEMAKIKYVMGLIEKKRFDYSQVAEYQKYNMDLFISAISDNPNVDSDDSIEHESAMLYPEYREYYDSHCEALRLMDCADSDLEVLQSETLSYETDVELYRAAYDSPNKRNYWSGYEAAVEARSKEIAQMMKQITLQKGGKK